MSAPLSLVEARVGCVDDVPLYEGRVVRIDGRALAVFHTEVGFYALDNSCTHMGGPLADGLVTETTVACPLHDRRFELANGRAVGHECRAVTAYPIREHDGDLLVSVPRRAAQGAPASRANGSTTSGAHRAGSALALAERVRGEDAEDDAAVDLNARAARA